ncbi:MAG: DUF2797 domain-containing protein [Bacteroidales bacterium]
MEWKGILRKMQGEWLCDGSGCLLPVKYRLPVGEWLLDVDEWPGREIELRYFGEIYCIRCGRKTKTSFAQGYCYPCFLSAPETDACVLKPELCRAHEGVSRDMEWSKEHCLIDHFVYLALTSGVKVGVTRHTQIPGRWIDQGAWKAIRLARTPDRHTAGLIEVELKRYFSDKTNWRDMLRDVRDKTVDLVREKDRAAQYLIPRYESFLVEDDRIEEILYPVNRYPEKVKSLNLDKTPLYRGVLEGIRGQYLIFADGTVFNVRKHGGYLVSLSLEE